MIVHTCDPSTQEAKPGGVLWLEDQLGTLGLTCSLYTARLFHEKSKS